MILNCSICETPPGRRLWRSPRVFDSLDQFAEFALEAFNDRTTVQVYEAAELGQPDTMIAYVEVHTRTRYTITEVPY